RDHEKFWLRIQNAGKAIKHSGFNIVDCPGAHINQIAAYARKMHLSAPLDWIMIDHMHLIGADGRNEIERLTQVSNTTKRIARELGIPVILLAQLSRAVESRPDKRPVMSDIRGSGSVEQDADIIHFVYRDDYYHKGADNPNVGLVEVDTAKQRDGELGVAVLENVYSQSRLVMTDRKIIQPTRQSKLSMIEGLGHVRRTGKTLHRAPHSAAQPGRTETQLRRPPGGWCRGGPASGYPLGAPATGRGQPPHHGLP